MTVLILTPLPLEYTAVVKHLTGASETIYKDQAAYEKWEFQGKHHRYTVIVREPGMKNVDMALATEKAVQSFQPQLALLVGIAGGVKDVQIGDVLIAKKVYGYEAGKEDADGFKSRPSMESFSSELLARAQVLSRRGDWKRRTDDGAPDAKVFIGPIAAGDKVVADTNNATFQQIKSHYNDTLGLEMEAIGFAAALQAHRLIHGLAIRGISDLCEGKAETDRHNWQPVAAERAAAFGFELLYELDASAFIASPAAQVKAPEGAAAGKPAQLAESLFDLVGNGKAKEAIPKLRQFTKTQHPMLHLAALQLSERWEDFERRSLMGMLSNNERNVERSQITGNLLELIGKLREEE